jgi:hypothetical protein
VGALFRGARHCDLCTTCHFVLCTMQYDNVSGCDTKHVLEGRQDLSFSSCLSYVVYIMLCGVQFASQITRQCDNMSFVQHDNVTVRV